MEQSMAEANDKSQPTPGAEDSATANAETTAATPETPTPEVTAMRVAELEKQLEAAKVEAAQNWDRFLRERAEIENLRKRVDRAANDRVRREKRELLGRVLDVVDNLDRALAFQDTMDRESLQQGLRMLQWQLNELLKTEGLTAVPAVGEPFDPYVHEAVETTPSKDQPEGTIVEELRKGYRLGDEVLRPARVKVSSGPKE
jgi:molecular chaperone GrpE